MVLGIGTSHARELYEKGDAIYRSNQAFWPAGHAGVLCKWDQSNSNDYANQSVIESLPSGVEQTNFHSFYSASDFWGMRTASLTCAQRDKVVEAAQKMLSSPHRKYDFTYGYKNPNGMTHPLTGEYIDPSFRCDGLVEWCYEQAGADIVPNDTWMAPAPPGYITLSPTVQMQFLILRTTAVVNDTEIIAPSIKNSKHPYYRRDVDLRAIVGDSNNGSGIAKVKFYNNIPLGDSNYISTDDHDEAISGLYKTTWSTTQNDDGKHNICFKSYDQAGNNRNDIIEIIVDNTPPLIVTNLASSTHEINKWYNKNNAKITTTWTAAEDDTTYTNDVSGIDGYGVLWNTSATGLPPEQKTIEAVTSTTSGALPDGRQYFHIRSVDKAGNWDDAAVHIGPFWIDKTPPNIAISIVKEIPGATLPGGKKWIKARIFRVTVTNPMVNDARSGLKEVLINGTAQALTHLDIIL